jgi:hypothetical protein
MAKTTDNTKLADMNAPTPTSGNDTSHDAQSPRDSRLTAPTPDSVKDQSKDDHGKSKSDHSGSAHGHSDHSDDAHSDKSHDKSDDTSMAQSAKARVAAEAEKAQSAAADQVNSRAEQIKEAGEAFDDGSFARRATDSLADNLTRAAQSIRTTDLGGLQQDLTHFARRQPLMFFGGAALLGFAAARMLKATDRGHDSGSSRTSQDKSSYKGYSSNRDRPADGARV